MSTEQYYMGSKEWESRTSEENSIYIERELLPKLIENALCLRSGKEASFAAEDEEEWMKVIAHQRRARTPKSLAIFLTAIFMFVLVLLVLFIKRFFF